MTKPASNWMIGVFVLGAVVFSVPATSDSSGRKFSRDGEVESAKPSRSSDGRGDSADVSSGPGEFNFAYDKRQRFKRAAMRSALLGQQAVNGIVGELTKQIALPFDIRVVFAECGAADAYYDNNKREITICHELIEGYYYLFSPKLEGAAARDDAVKGATVAIFLHELGHALIDGWDLPITGREEDAADQFAALWLINRLPEGEQMALNMARSFKLIAELEKSETKDYSDPHSPDGQRFYDTICLIYGRRPEKYEYLINNGTLPVERAFKCEEDYQRLSRSWRTLLGPHLVSQTALSLGFDALNYPRVSGYPSLTTPNGFLAIPGE